MHRRPTSSLTSTLATSAAAVLCGALLVSCSDDSEQPDDAPSSSVTPTASGSATAAAPSLDVPAGVSLTPEGSELTVGDTATVAYLVRQGVVGVLDITVTRLEETTFKESFSGWDLSAADKEAAPYFVRAEVTNVGETDLSSSPVPLYLVDGANALVEANTFGSKFAPCNPSQFPKSFPPGKTAKVCLVYLAPNDGVLKAVSFRPVQEVNPITWTGPVKEVEQGDKGKKSKGKDKKASTG